MKTEIIEYIKKSKIIITTRLMKKSFYKELLKMQKAAGFDDIIEYCYFLKTKDNGICQYTNCTNKTKFISFKKGYNNGCCENHTKKLNNLEKYGVENVMQSTEIKEKQQSTMLDKYGTTHALQNIKSLRKMKDTQNFNGGIGAANNETKSKMKSTNNKKYGVDNPMQDTKIYQKFKNTMKLKYGVENALENKIIKSKRIKTNLERFGAKHHMLSDNYKEKLKIDFIKNKLDKISFSVEPLFDILEYTDIEQELKWKCKTCGTEFIDNLDNGKIPRCLKCFPLINKGFSNAEKDLVSELKKDFSLIQNDRKILDGKELDILVPDKKIAIEFNGVYWHSELQGKNNNYHLDKTKKCEEKGIQLIQVFDTEWLEKRDIVLSIIREKLGKFQTKVFARDTVIKEIDKKMKKEFLEENHLQGNDTSSKMIGLFKNAELLSIMTFGIRDNTKNQYEMYSFCNKKDNIIVGGALKLWKYFIKMYNPEFVIVYDDKRYSDGSFYETIGFIKKDDSPPVPWYFKGTSGLFNIKKWKKQMLSKKLDTFNPQLTVWENMRLNGYNRIWDCGNYVFEWNKQVLLKNTW